MSQTRKSVPWKLLAVSLAIIVLFSFLASMFNTGMFTTSVSRISFETTGHGQLSGLLYMPKGASETDPRPAVIVTHGYLNSAEMQDANAIELSRRGYVVLALDMYDHGHSDINNEIYEGFAAYGDFLKTWAPFWLNSMYDAVQYMYGQDYVLKDAQGNGIIGITGHSMGGFSSTIAVANDERDFAANGYRKIWANLTEGSDFGYSGIFGVTAAAFDAAGGGRYLGKVAAQYDEFFFNDPAVQGGTVRHKDYVSTPDGMTFLQQTEAGRPNTWYATADGGHRIIYQPAETHPWNHFSTTTTGYAIDFYNTAFAPFMGNAAGGGAVPETAAGAETVPGAEEAAAAATNPGAEDAAPETAEPEAQAAPAGAPVWDRAGVSITVAGGSDQIWLWKELCECAALVGFILFILAIAKLLISLPFFSGARTGELPVQQSAGGAGGLAAIVVMLIAILLPAILFETMYGWSPASDGMWFLFCGAAFVALFGLAFIIKGNGKAQKIGGCIALVSGAAFAALTRFSLYTNTAFFTAPVVNDIAKWTVGSMFIALCVMSLVFLFSKSRNGVTLKDYGVTFKPMAILGGLCGAVVTVGLAYGLLFLVDLIFKTDFRIWTFAFKTFDGSIFPAILRYLPTFLAYYIVSTAAICINTNTERLQGWKGYLVAVALNCGGIIIWLARQYITMFATGVSAHPNAALSGIVLVAMVPTLAIAACISRYLYKRTGNIWLPAFINGLLMTIMTVANTTVFYK